MQWKSSSGYFTHSWTAFIYRLTHLRQLKIWYPGCGVSSQGSGAPAPPALTSATRESTHLPVWPSACPRLRAPASPAQGSCSWKNLQRATRGAKDRLAGQTEDKGKWVLWRLLVAGVCIFTWWMCFNGRVCGLCFIMSRTCVFLSFSD